MGPALMGSAIVGALAAGMSSLVGRVMLAIGVSFATFQGLDVLIANVTSQMQSSMGGIGAAAAWLSVLQIDTQLTIITSAWTTRLTLAAVDGTIKKAVLK